MKKLTLPICSMCLFLFANSAFAESLPEQCNKKDKEIQDMANGVEAIKKEIADLENKLSELKNQQADLEKKNRMKVKTKRGLEKKIRKEQRTKKRMCAPIIQCKTHEATFSKWKTKIEPIVKELQKIREEIANSIKSADELSMKVEKIEAEYNQLKCRTLKAGKTEQKTIDRCHELFTQWNNMEGDINKTNERIVELKKKYRGIMQRMAPARLALIGLHKKMRKACNFSERLKDLDGMNKKQEEYSNIQTDLNKMDSKFRKIKKLRLIKPKLPTKQANVAKPKVGPPKKDKTGKKPGKKGLKLKISGKAGGKASGKAKGNIKVGGK